MGVPFESERLLEVRSNKHRRSCTIISDETKHAHADHPKHSGELELENSELENTK